MGSGENAKHGNGYKRNEKSHPAEDSCVIPFRRKRLHFITAFHDVRGEIHTHRNSDADETSATPVTRDASPPNVRQAATPDYPKNSRTFSKVGTPARAPSWVHFKAETALENRQQ